MRVNDENDLVYAIMERVRILADKNIPELRRIADVMGPEASAEMANKFSSKGELISEIIRAEFEAETPRSFES